MAPPSAVIAILMGLIMGVLAVTTVSARLTCPSHDEAVWIAIPTGQGVPETASAVAETPSNGPAASSPTPPLPEKEPAAPRSGTSETAPALDLTSLEKRLRETHAIGILTKIALKNQVDDLLEQFRAFHQGRRGASLTKLREQFSLLFLKVLSLVQDDDPGLARDIASSREAIWNFLTDPAEFAKLTGGNAR